MAQRDVDATEDVVIQPGHDGSGTTARGNVIVKTGGVERGRITQSGTATGCFAGGVQSVSAADSTIVVGGTATDVTLRTSGGSAGNPIVHRIPFAYNTPSILTGATMYTPTSGDMLLDLWVEIDTLWNGTTPFLDIGTFDHVATGIFSNWYGAALAMDQTADAANQGYSCIAQGGTLSSIRDLVAITMPTAFNDSLYAVAGANVNLANSPAAGNRLIPAKFVSATPLKVCVSQTGANDGASPGATQGAGALCLVTATPIAT